MKREFEPPPTDEESRERHPTALWVADVVEMEARRRRRIPVATGMAVTLEAYQEGDEPA